MPAKDKIHSRAQMRFLEGVAHGNIKEPGLSAAKAKEMVAGPMPKGLPQHAKKGKK